MRWSPDHPREDRRPDRPAVFADRRGGSDLGRTSAAVAHAGQSRDSLLADAGFGDDAHFSIYENDDTLRVVGDLPGIEQDGIDIKCDGRTLTVTARSDRREYEERLDLPARVDEHAASASFNNGVLEVTLERTGNSADIDL